MLTPEEKRTLQDVVMPMLREMIKDAMGEALKKHARATANDQLLLQVKDLQTTLKVGREPLPWPGSNLRAQVQRAKDQPISGELEVWASAYAAAWAKMDVEIPISSSAQMSAEFADLAVAEFRKRYK